MESLLTLRQQVDPALRCRRVKPRAGTDLGGREFLPTARRPGRTRQGGASPQLLACIVVLDPLAVEELTNSP